MKNMGNRAVITTDCASPKIANSQELGVYLHWNGGRDCVEGFLAYCDLRGFPSPEQSDYGWARFCQVVGNFFGGELSIGIDKCKNLDCRNVNNGVYIIKNWEIVGRQYFVGDEENNYSLYDVMVAIDRSQPVLAWVGPDAIREYISKKKQDNKSE